jgi:radical SAM superfamily enzyme YgiQ (UPF0313 family)
MTVMSKAANKVLFLVMPPQIGLLRGFSAGLIALANYVSSRTTGVRVEIVDLSEGTDRIFRELDYKISSIPESSQLFVGFTVTTASYQYALAVGRKIKKLRANSIIVFGGHHPSADYETVLRNHTDIVDIVVIGEGERSLHGLISEYPHLDRVPGIAWLASGAGLRRNVPAEPLNTDELDSIPVTYGDLRLIGTPGKFDHATYVSARGCPLKCAFCAVGNEKIRTKSVEAVVTDLKRLIDMGYHRIAIEDNFFAHSVRRTREVCDALSEIRREYGQDFVWDCQTRVESLARPGIVEMLENAGCEAVYVGMESVVKEQLIYLNKTASPDKYLLKLLEVVEVLLDSHVDCYLNLQLGFRNENTAQLEETLSFLRRIGGLAETKGKRITIFPQLHVIYPGTHHFQAGVAEGRFSQNLFEAFTEWETRELPVLFWLGEHFAHGTGGLPEGILFPDKLKTGEFEIDAKAVFRVLDYLRQIEYLPGIQVFKYGEFLVSSAQT